MWFDLNHGHEYQRMQHATLPLSTQHDGRSNNLKRVAFFVHICEFDEDQITFNLWPISAESQDNASSTFLFNHNNLINGTGKHLTLSSGSCRAFLIYISEHSGEISLQTIHFQISGHATVDPDGFTFNFSLHLSAFFLLLPSYFIKVFTAGVKKVLPFSASPTFGPVLYFSYELLIK